MVKPTQKSVLKIAVLSLLIMVVFYISNINMLGYGLGQLKGQIALLLKRQPVSEIMSQKETSTELKNKLLFIDSVMLFGINELGFKPTNNYKTFVELQGKPVLWTLSASEKFALKPFMWKYPILGEMAYKGYFDSLKLANEALHLKELGFEVCEGEVIAWSTLGFLPDPILSSMLELPKGKLARLILHELTHSEVFISSDADLNENLASFMGDKGALLFLEMQYGNRSEPLQELHDYLFDLKILTDYTLEFKTQLEFFYTKIERLPEIQKQTRKELFLEGYVKGLRNQKLKNPKNFEKLLNSETLPKNCFFNDFMMYRNYQGEFEMQLKENHQNNLKSFIGEYKKKYGNSINPFL